MNSFQASKSFVTEFKKRYKLVSRKITKITTSKALHDAEGIQERAANFVNSVKEEIRNEENLSFERIVNADQSGIQLEMSFGRTISKKGEVVVPGVVQRVSATTHSFTIMPTISSNGKLLDPLYVALKEKKDMSFGKNVEKNMFKHDKLVVQASKSGNKKL